MAADGAIGRVTRLPEPCLVVLVGPAGCGKSTWAARWFRPEHVISSDRLRAMVGTGEHDQRAGTAAFEVLDLVIDHRLRRRLTTVVDSTALEAARRKVYVDTARRRGVAVVAAVFDLPEHEVRRRNRQRADGVPAAVLTAQLRSFAAAQRGHRERRLRCGGAGRRRRGRPRATAIRRRTACRQPSTGGPDAAHVRTAAARVSRGRAGRRSSRQRLADVAAAAEQAGFDSIWVMDHYVQIPQVGREWEEMLEAYTTLGYLAGLTRTARLGALCTGITYRNVAALGKIVATLDVLSGGRAMAGLGIAWFEREHQRLRLGVPAARATATRCSRTRSSCCRCCGARARRAFEGRTITVPEAICYPRPLQERVPILVGGSGERRTLRLVARYADACNLFGDAATVRHKIDVLHRHCADVDRDPAEVTVTNLTRAQVIGAGDERPAEFAGTLEEQIGRYRTFAEAGVQTAIVSLPDVAEGGIERFAPVIAAFR